MIDPRFAPQAQPMQNALAQRAAGFVPGAPGGTARPAQPGVPMGAPMQGRPLMPQSTMMRPAMPAQPMPGAPMPGAPMYGQPGAPAGMPPPTAPQNALAQRARGFF